MDPYETEKEQVEKIKQWWDANGKAIIIGLSVGIFGIFGYRYWESNRMLAGESASINFEHLVAIAQAGPSDEATAAGEALIEGAPESSYAKFAALLLAKLAVDANDYDGAKQRLQWVIDQDPASKIATIAYARLAQLQLAQGEVEAARETFDNIDPDEQLRFAELHGDILVASGEAEAAREKYQAALQQAREFAIDQEPIRLKLENIGLLYADKP